MRFPRDLSGEELARLLARYGYAVSRQMGSHMRLTSIYKGGAHHVTIPRHKFLKIGTLSAIIEDVAAYLEMEKQNLGKELFG